MNEDRSNKTDTESSRNEFYIQSLEANQSKVASMHGLEELPRTDGA